MARRDPAAGEPSADDVRFFISLLQTEAHQFDDHMRNNINHVYRFGGLVFAFFTAAAPVLAKNHQYQALLAIPPLTMIVWLLGLRALAEAFALAAQRSVSEERMRSLLEARSLRGYVPWEAAGGHVMRRTLVNGAVYGGFVVLSLIVDVYCFTAAEGHLPTEHHLLVGDIGLVALLALVVLACVLELLLVVEHRVVQLTHTAPEGELPVR
jgi:hypothetical protein